MSEVLQLLPSLPLGDKGESPPAAVVGGEQQSIQRAGIGCPLGRSGGRGVAWARPQGSDLPCKVFISNLDEDIESRLIKFANDTEPGWKANL